MYCYSGARNHFRKIFVESFNRKICDFENFDNVHQLAGEKRKAELANFMSVPVDAKKKLLSRTKNLNAKSVKCYSQT